MMPSLHMVKPQSIGRYNLLNMTHYKYVCLCILFALGLFCERVYGQVEAPNSENVTYDRDWIKTQSGEWVGGDIESFYEDTLIFDSNEFDTQEIDRDDIAEIKSPHTFRLRLNGGRIYTGRIELKDKVLYVYQGVKTEKVLFDNVLTMVPFDDTRISLWSGSINLGANFRKGNTNQNDANLRLQLQRSTALNRLKFDYIINKSKQGAVNESLEETTNNQRLNLNFDWFFSERLFLRPLQFEFYSDPFSNIDKRYTYGLGIGYRIIDFKKVTWHATAGPGYQHTRYTIATDDNANIVDSKALILSTTLDWEVTNKIDFIFDYQIQLLEKEVGEVLQTLKTGFDIEIISDFEIDILLYVERNNNPQQIVSDLAFVKNDYQLMFSLGYEF